MRTSRNITFLLIAFSLANFSIQGGDDPLKYGDCKELDKISVSLYSKEGELITHCKDCFIEGGEGIQKENLCMTCTFGWTWTKGLQKDFKDDLEKWGASSPSDRKPMEQMSCKLHWLVWVTIAVGILLIIGAVIFFIIKKKKANAKI